MGAQDNIFGHLQQHIMKRMDLTRIVLALTTTLQVKQLNLQHLLEMTTSEVAFAPQLLISMPMTLCGMVLVVGF